MTGRQHFGFLLSVLALTCAGCGPKRPREAATTAGTATPAPAGVGEQVYDLYCAVCHMPDGEGVSNFQPALRGSAIVSGDPAKLEAVIRAGSAALQDREARFSTEMPPFGTLSDDEVKAIVAYVRERFGTADNGKAP